MFGARETGPKTYDHVSTTTDVSEKLDYSCEQCDKSFLNHFGLVRHTRIHTGELPYYCDFCNQIYVDLPALGVHEKIRHINPPNLIRYPCYGCKNVYDTYGELIDHAQAEHRAGKFDFCGILFCIVLITGTVSYVVYRGIMA